MKLIEYIKKVGKETICRICNYDLRDIANHLVRETDLKAGTSQLSRALKDFRQLIENKVPKSEQSQRIIEIKRKLRGE